MSRHPSSNCILPLARLLATLGGIALVSSCAGEGIRDPVGNGPSCAVASPFRPTLGCIQELVFTPSCAVSGCHLNPAAQLGMDLSDGMAYASTVNVPSVEDPTRLRIAAGDPDDSYLILKLEGSPLVSGERMPLGGPYLSQAEIDVIRQWISDGAPEN